MTFRTRTFLSALISTALAKTFDHNRGLATGIANSGATAGQFITVPLVTAGLAYVDWRWSIIAVAIACAIMALPASGRPTSASRLLLWHRRRR